MTAIPEAARLDLLTSWTQEHPELQVWVKDLRSRFLAVSVGLAQSRGVLPEEMRGRTEAEFFPQDLVRQFRRDDVRVVALNQEAVFEEFGPGGHFATFKRPLRDERGRVSGTFGIAYRWSANDSPPVPPRIPAIRPPPPWLGRLWERLNADFRTAISIQQLAAEVGRHPNHVSRAIRLHFGVAAIEWIHRLRVAWIAERLISEDDNLSVIAQHAGFADQAHMTRVFGRYYGLPPAQFRRAMSLAR